MAACPILPELAKMSNAVGDKSQYYVVGTAIVKPEEYEPTKGRILVLQYRNNKVELVDYREVKGSVYALTAFQGKLLASVNNKVNLYKWTSQTGGQQELVSECGIPVQVLALYMATR